MFSQLFKLRCIGSVSTEKFYYYCIELCYIIHSYNLKQKISISYDANFK